MPTEAQWEYAARAGSDDVYDTAFRRAGMLRVRTLEELFDADATRYGFFGEKVLAELSAEELAEALPAACTVVVGEGASAVAGAAAERAQRGMELLPAVLGRARAFYIGLLGARLLAKGKGQPAEDLVPRYVRRAEAEVRRTGRRLVPRRVLRRAVPAA